MIVLAIIAGLTAMVWPNLSRSLADRAVLQAAQDLRGRLVECRRQAELSGEIILVRFQAGSGEFAWGPWEAMGMDELEVEVEGKGLRWERLAEGIELVAPRPEFEQWTLPIFPDGRVATDVLLLRDTASGAMASITHDPVTGMMKSARYVATSEGSFPEGPLSESVSDGVAETSIRERMP